MTEYYIRTSNTIFEIKNVGNILSDEDFIFFLSESVPIRKIAIKKEEIEYYFPYNQEEGNIFINPDLDIINIEW